MFSLLPMQEYGPPLNSSQVVRQKLREGRACSASHGSCVRARPLCPSPALSPLHVADETGLRVLWESEHRNNLSHDVSSAPRCRKQFIFISWASGFIWQPREGKVIGVLYIFQICRNKISFLNKNHVFLLLWGSFGIRKEVSVGWGRAL